ncbi:GNAT family N-acetyltransferase [Agromyces atrinae]|uniref:GNAT family N-acetyltransferase n=1 Tax=Agromyces atrinae TaxID=592376 RepID=UPI001F5908A9|nr:GNAT family N-acetyltransferase [Agromyces atrinae]MCI2957438.1 GNAT family N-acetyltransferase [Agromyces atrinae]
MTHSIRRATATDAASLAELAAETFPLACPPHTSAEAIADFIATHFTEARFDEYLSDTDRELFVAVSDDALLLGYSMIIRGEPSDPDVAAAVTLRPTVELSKFYVRRAAHGAGVAGELMRATLEAAAVGASGAWLGVNEENAHALRFYAKHGFEMVGRKRFLVGARYEDDFVLERSF